MEGLFQAKKLIDSARNVLILTSRNPGVDDLGSALSLSYTLNNRGKIVNFFPKEVPKKYSPLFPPKAIPEKFVISIRDKEISELYYEKENQILNIFLSPKDDKIEKQDIRFTAPQGGGAANQESDLLVAIGIERLEQLGSFYEKNFKLFYQTPILNIDNRPLNNKFGNINLIFEDLPIAVTSAKLINSFNKKSNSSIKTWLLAGIIDFSQRKEINQETLKSIFSLTEADLNYGEIIDFFDLSEKPGQTKLLETALKKLEFRDNQQLPLVCLAKSDFQKSKTRPKDLGFVLEQLINKFFHFPSLLLLWESGSPDSYIRGVFYSSNKNAVTEISKRFKGRSKGRGVIFGTKERNMDKAREKVIKTIS
jgi:nanoRNase/pAp phosphatase (c-di-AMP/oligoRNAs hydrolase)